jgi:hypothetical protein
VLVSIADSLAGVETSRLRWQRDIDMGRQPLTFNGEEATVPDALSSLERLAVSFLLEADRARALRLRWPLIDLRAVLARHVVPGGPAVDSGRLDYLLAWAEAQEPLDHRAVSDEIAADPHTPGARLSNSRSDAIHNSGRHHETGDAPVPLRYHALVRDELSYKAGGIDRALAVLASLPVSRLRAVHRALEGDAQTIWRARLNLHASDLVRFGRTNWVWRNNHVAMLDADAACSSMLAALGNPQAARDMALDSGTREVALAMVTSVDPLRIVVESRRIVAGSSVVALHINGVACVEAATIKVQKGSFKFGNLSAGELVADAPSGVVAGLLWYPVIAPAVAVGDVLVVADMSWFGGAFSSGHHVAVVRPPVDTTSAPKADCDDGSYADNPDDHQYCCRSHETSESEWSDKLALRRQRGELNPQTWPPIIDEDQFDTVASGTPTAEGLAGADSAPATNLTIDDLG